MIPELHRHIILYSKHWYQKTETIADLKKIIGEVCGYEAEYCSPTDIWEILTEIFILRVSVTHQRQYLHRLFNNGQFAQFQSTLDFAVAVDKMVGIFSVITCRKDGELIVDLGAPDPNILPIKALPLDA